MARTMTANLHISTSSKIELDEIIPKKVNGEKITYDDYIQATLWFLKENLNFGQHDIIDMIVSYKADKLNKSKSENSAI